MKSNAVSKLATKTLFFYLATAFVLLLVSAPLFYFLARQLYMEEVDEDILLRKEEFMRQNALHFKQREIPIWNRFNRDIRILPDTVTAKKEELTEVVLYDSLEAEWEPYRVLYTDIIIQNGKYILMTRMNLVESEDIVETTAFLYLIIFSLLLAGFVVVSRIFSGYLWKPFYKTLSRMENFDIRQQREIVFDPTRTKEFAQMNRAVQKLIGQNLAAFRTLKEFSENASHELQTPLAVFQSKLDLLLQSPGLTREQALLIEQLYESISKLSRINRNLLLLSRMENEQFTHKEEIDMTTLAHETLPPFVEQAEVRQIEIQTEFDGPVKLLVNKGWVEILINNLILNAIRHNIDHGNITLRITPEKMEISNTAGDKALEPEKLFQRFGKKNTASGGTGLGLAIIKKIADYHGWQTIYNYDQARHIFTIYFTNSKNLQNPD